MPTEQKRQKIEELKQKITACTIAIATDYRNMTVNNMTELRRRLRERGVEYRVVKNTLTHIAAQEEDRTEFQHLLEGTTAIAFGYDDPREPARVLEEFIRTTRLPLRIRSGVMDGQLLTPSQITALVTLPSREELVAQLLQQLLAPSSNLVQVLSAPLVQMVNVLNGPLQGLITVLQQRVAQQQPS